MRRLLLSSVVLVLAGSIPALAAPEFFQGWRNLSVDHQYVRVSTSTRTTSSIEWRGVPEFNASSGLIFDTRHGVSVTLSVQISGAPAEFRVSTAEYARQKYKVVGPGSVYFDPMGGTNSFSFTFMKDATSPGNREMILEWKSPTGGEVTLEKLSVVVIYAES
jgi:hypothetical protein